MLNSSWQNSDEGYNNLTTKKLAVILKTNGVSCSWGIQEEWFGV